MRLITGSRPAVNPIIDDNFKEQVIRPMAERKLKSEKTDRSDTRINVTSELVSEWLPSVLGRFSCCTCSRCKAEASVKALELLPAIVVEIRGKKDIDKAKALKEENKQWVLMTLVKIAIERKKLPHHQE